MIDDREFRKALHLELRGLEADMLRDLSKDPERCRREGMEGTVQVDAEAVRRMIGAGHV